ncbi:MarC family protein [Shigella flexneri]
MSVLKHTEPKRRRAIMVRELLIALLVMLVFLFAGEKNSGISQPASRNRLRFLAASFCFNCHVR